MRTKIAVFGAGDQGQVMAADLTLAGHKVNLLELPESEGRIADISERGGIHLSGEKRALISGRSGFAELKMITVDPEKALKDVRVLFIDAEPKDYENRITAIAQYLNERQIVNFIGYGYWACLRAANMLKQMDKEGILLSESPAPIHWARRKGDCANSYIIRQKVPLGVFPSRRTKKAFDVLKIIAPTFQMAKNVLQTNLENLNMLVHPGKAILNMGAIDRADANNAKFNFYVDGNTDHTGIFEDAYDRERIAVCKACRVPYTSLKEHLIRYYGSKGETVQEAIRNTGPYQDPGWLMGIKQITDIMVGGDVPLAMVPYVALADLSSVPTPIADALIEMFGAVFHMDFWKSGLTLDKLGIEGLNIEEIDRYVTNGTS